MEKPIQFPAYMTSAPEPIEGPTTLSERRYLLKFQWSPLLGGDSGVWTMDIRDAQGVVIGSTIPVVISGDLLDLYRDDERTPPGAFVVSRVEGTQGDPRETDLGGPVEITYVT